MHATLGHRAEYLMLSCIVLIKVNSVFLDDLRPNILHKLLVTLQARLWIETALPAKAIFRCTLAVLTGNRVEPRADYASCHLAAYHEWQDSHLTVDSLIDRFFVLLHLSRQRCSSIVQHHLNICLVSLGSLEEKVTCGRFGGPAFIFELVRGFDTRKEQLSVVISRHGLSQVVFINAFSFATIILRVHILVFIVIFVQDLYLAEHLGRLHVRQSCLPGREALIQCLLVDEETLVNSHNIVLLAVKREDTLAISCSSMLN